MNIRTIYGSEEDLKNFTAGLLLNSCRPTKDIAPAFPPCGPYGPMPGMNPNFADPWQQRRNQNIHGEQEEWKWDQLFRKDGKGIFIQLTYGSGPVDGGDVVELSHGIMLKTSSPKGAD